MSNDTSADVSEFATTQTHEPGPTHPWWRERRAIALGAALLISAIAACSVYFLAYRPDQSTGPAARQQVLDAAKSGAEAVLSYAPDSIDANLSAAKSDLTGEFLKQYTDFADTVVAPAAKQRGVKTEASVTRAAISEIAPKKANVLLFINQVTTSKDRPNPALATSSVMVTLVKTSGRWLISEFKPI